MLVSLVGGMSAPRLYGLVLAGGASKRMQRDKALLRYRGVTQLERVFELAARHCECCFVSVRASQTEEPSRASKPLIIDSVDGEGPMIGIRSAMAAHPDVAWLVLACDLPFLSDATLERLVAERDAAGLATAYRSAHDGLPEPLCAIWEPRARAALLSYGGDGGGCPRKFLMRSNARLIEPVEAAALDNVNTPADYLEAQTRLSRGAGQRTCFRLELTPIDVGAARRELLDPGAGAYVSFEGWVRNFNEGREVNRLEYEAFEALAVAEGDRIMTEALRRFPIKHALCVHRLGDLPLSEMAVWVGVSAAHRGEAFDACRYIIDEIKHRVPIWKKEHYRDGHSGWVNCEACAAAPHHADSHAHAAADAHTVVHAHREAHGRPAAGALTDNESAG